ncbi:type II toxin-antitoxin system VapC family toxin [Sphingomonas sp. SUN019]|nr:type II toxin-antitoxin system VapC family toxin [Sphingomonas sp. SUN019]
MAHHPAALKRTMRHRPGDVVLSSIVVHELMFGAFNSERVTANLDRLSALDFPVLSFDADDGRVAGEIRARLRRTGTPIGPFDVLIAGQSLARDLTLVTANTREFARIKGLRLENWME